MAKITPSSLITEIKGKWAGMTFQMWKGVITARRTPHPHQTPKLSRALYKGVVSTIAGCWDRLTATQSACWDDYADLLPTVMTGFNAFLARNSTLLLARHTDLKAYFTAPETYVKPTSPTPFCVDYCTVTDSFCLAWTDPACADLYVQGFYDPQAGYSNLRSPSWRLLQTVQSAKRQMSLDASTFPSGLIIRFRVRTINIYGETSFVPAGKPATIQPSIRVISPNGGEEWYVWYTYTIFYQASQVNLVKIEYQTGPGGDWYTIVASTAATGSYSWTIPEDTTVSCRIKITDLSQPATFDISDNVFTLTASSSRYISLVAPNGGEDWIVDSQHYITWISNAVSFVKIEYSTDNGSSWDPVIESTPAGPGSYPWTIPDEPSALCLVRITATTQPLITDSSAGTFTISSAGPSVEAIADWLMKNAGYEDPLFIDQTGNGHDITNNGITVGDDYSTLDGDDRGHATDFLMTGNDHKELTVACWIYLPDPADGFILSHRNWKEGTWWQNGWQIYISSRKMYVEIWTDPADNTTKKDYRSSVNLPLNTWCLVGFSFNNGVLKLFNNSVEDPNPTIIQDDAFNTVADSPAYLRLGCAYRNGDLIYFFVGRMSRNTIYPGVLTQDDWDILYSQGH